MKKLAIIPLALALLLTSACTAFPTEEFEDETAAEDTEIESTSENTEAEADSDIVEVAENTSDIEESTEQPSVSTEPRGDESEPPVDTDITDIGESIDITRPVDELKSTENFGKLDAILSKDSFDVSVTNIGVTPDAVDFGKDAIGAIMTPFGNDALTFTVDFGGLTDIASLTLTAVGVDVDGNLTQLRENTVIDVLHSPMDTDPTEIIEFDAPADAKGMKLHLWCNRDKFEYVFAFISEYTLSDGTVVKNPVTVDFENTVSHRAYDLAPFDGVFSDNDAFCELVSLENGSDFGLTVTARFGYLDMNTSSLLNPDALRIAVENSTDVSIVDYTVYAVGINADGEFVSINWAFSLSKGGVVNKFRKAGTSIEPGGTDTADLECFLGDFVTARAIVASYTAEDGTVYDNPIATQWVNAATVK